MATARIMAEGRTDARRAPLPTLSRKLVNAIEAAIEAEHAAENRRKRGKRSSAMFYFAHSVHGALADLGETEALDAVGQVLQMRHPGARDPWAEEFPDCPVDRPVAFVESLHLIQFPPGIFARAVAVMKSRLVSADEISPGFARFRVLCQVLQELHGNQPFILAVKRFAEALDVSRESITVYKRRAMREGWLELVSDSIPLTRAARFRFVPHTTSHEGSGGFLKVLEGRNTGRGARAMLSAFASVGASAFDVTLTDIDGKKVAGKYKASRTFEKLCGTIGRILQHAEHDRHNVIIRPRSTTVTLVQLDDLDAEKAKRITPHAFMVIRTSPGNHQAWIALKDATADFSRRLKKGVGADASASGATRIAGSRNFKADYAPSFPIVEISHASAGKVVSVTALEGCGFVAAPEEPHSPAPPVAHLRGSPRRWPDYERCVRGAPSIHRGHRPDISRADFTWCRTAIDWGWSIEETACRLMELSSKAKEDGKRYALQTAKGAAESVERER